MFKIAPLTPAHAHPLLSARQQNSSRSFPSQMHTNILNMLLHEPSSSVRQAQAGLMRCGGSGCPIQTHCMTPFVLVLGFDPFVFFFFSSPLESDSQIWASEELLPRVSIAEMLKLLKETDDWWCVDGLWARSIFMALKASKSLPLAQEVKHEKWCVTLASFFFVLHPRAFKLRCS